MLPASLVMLGSAPLAGRVASRFGARIVLLLGGLGSALSLGMLAVRHGHPVDYVVAGCVMGFSSGFVMSAGAMLVVELSHPRDVGVATGINSVARTTGAALGSVILASVVASSVPDGGHIPTEAGFAAAYWVGAGAALLSALLAFTVPRSRTTPTVAPVVPAEAAREPATV
jgi:MFS family permease